MVKEFRTKASLEDKAYCYGAVNRYQFKLCIHLLVTHGHKGESILSSYVFAQA